MDKLKRALAAAALLGIMAAGGAGADTRILVPGSTGIPLEGHAGFLGEKDGTDSVIAETDESGARAVFFWDNADLEARVRVFLSGSGRLVAEYELRQGNLIVLPGPGTYELRIERIRGTGHWACILLGKKEWDIK